MSQSARMDVDVPVPSIEHEDPSVAPLPTRFTSFRNTTDSPLRHSSPNRTPFKTPLSNSNTPAPSSTPRSPSLGRNDRKQIPGLQLQRSTSSLSLSRGQASNTQLRRVSSNLNPSSPTIKSSEMASQPLTAGSVARDYFQREIESHAGRQSETIVIVHDACYGHRFSRPRTSKAALSTIVERPERIHATLLGASTAYVRLGERHAEGRYGPHPDRNVKTLPDPPFILKKTTRSIQLNHPAVTHVHGTKWMEELQIMCDSAESKLAMNGKELQRPIGYGKDESGNNLPKLHEGDLYLCSESLAALQGCLGGVCDATDSVFGPSMTKRAFVCIRPPGHHCSSNYPSGFCWLNNVHVGISYAAMNHGLTHAAIIDFDLHHGDGSQTITWDHNRKASSLPKNAAQHRKTPIGYYSLHDINSYPCEWGDEDKVRNASLCIENAHGQSIWNVHLEAWQSLEHFWQLYQARYTVLLEKTKSFLRHHSNRLRDAGIQPKGAIFISAGFDASQWEGQGMQRHSVNVPTEFYAKFTSDIVQLAETRELGVDGRVISVLEGGYSDRALTSGVLSHLCGLSGRPIESLNESGLAQQISNGLGIKASDDRVMEGTQALYDPEWWHEANLEALENRVAGNVSSPPRIKEKGLSHFSSPTQASTAKMTDVARERKSISAHLEARLLLQTSEPEPPPEVNWIISSYELSRVLIPDDRQTFSCRHDELNAEATKARRERQSAIGVAVVPDQRMQLRTRGKAPATEPEAIRAVSRSSNRRTTIAAVSELPDPSMASQRPRRRSSAASSILSSFQDMKLDEGNTANADRGRFENKASALPASAGEAIAKKTRMPPPAKKAPSRVSSPRKPKSNGQPVAKSTSLREKLLDAKTDNNPAAVSSPPQSDPTYDVGKSASNDLDDLTNSMKKVSIKLKMPTLEQHEENQKKVEETKTKKPRIARKPPVPKVTKTKQTQPGASALPSSVSDQKAVGVAAAPIGQSIDNVRADVSATDYEKTAAAVGPDVHQTGYDLAHDDQSRTFQTMPGWNSYQNGNHPDPATTGPTFQDASDMPTSMATTNVGSELPSYSSTTSSETHNSLQRTKADLPIFTSSSPIPFAPAMSSAQKIEEQQGSSIWDVPDTPRQ